MAVLAVVIFHAWPGALPGGFVGVDVFFVISGFLISGILWRDLAAGTFSLADFYRKRVRRIFPALFVMLLTTLAAGAVILPPEAYAELARTALSSLFFVSNVDFWRHSGYFDRAAELRPLLHTWSLSVEEQYYLLFPLALAGVMRFARRWLLLLTAIAVLLLIGLSEGALRLAPLAAYFLSPFRAFELLLGALAAFAPVLSGALARRAIVQGMALAGLALIGMSLGLLSPQTPFPGVVAVLPTLGTAAVLYAGRHAAATTGPAAWMLGLGPMQGFGAISYSLYLWHWPVMAYLRILTPHEPAVPMMAAALGLSTLLAWLSYRHVERPCAALPVRGWPILRAGASGMVALGLGAAAIWGTQGLPARFSPETRALFAAAEDVSPWRAACHQSDNGRRPYDQSCILGGPGDQTPAVARLAVWGDSHGAELAAALAPATGPLRQITASACPPVIGVDFPDRPHCRSANEAVLRDMLRDETLTTVILAANAETYDTPGLSALETGYARTVESLVDAGKRVVLLGQIPNPERDAPLVAGRARAWGGDPARIGRPLAEVTQQAAPWNGFLAGLAARKGLVLVDPAAALCSEGFCPILGSGDQVLYFNPSHVSMAGARRIAGELDALLPARAAQDRLAAGAD